jgi:hypothetical protein
VVKSQVVFALAVSRGARQGSPPTRCLALLVLKRQSQPFHTGPAGTHRSRKGFKGCLVRPKYDMHTAREGGDVVLGASERAPDHVEVVYEQGYRSMTHLGAQGGVLTSRRRAVCLAIVGSLLAIVTLAEVRGHENVDGGQGLPAENQQRIALLEGVQNSNKNPNWDGMLTWSQPHAAALKKYPYQSLVAHLQPANHSTTLWVAPYVTKFNLTLDRFCFLLC